MKDTWLKIVICQLDVATVKGMATLERNAQVLNVLNVEKKDM